MTSTPLQVAQMAAVIANGGFLYRPRVIHHMTDAEGNVVIVNERSEIVARARPGPNGEAIITDADGQPLEDPSFSIAFDADGQPVFEPQVVDALAVDRSYLQVVAEGMKMVNERTSETEFFTGATYVDWGELERQGIPTAGKTGTSEYCDNIAIKRGWCRFEDIEQRRILPTHAWYVGYAPYDDPEIVVSVFVFNGGEGSAWAAPVACHVIAAYFGKGQYAALMDPKGTAEAAATVDGEAAPEAEGEVAPEALPTVCASNEFNPELPVLPDYLTGGVEEPALGEDGLPIEPTAAP
jgi:penicillin-binding protein 2